MSSLDLNVNASGDSITNVDNLFQSSVNLREKLNLRRFN